MIDDVVIPRRRRTVQSWIRGDHWPEPVQCEDGRWRCGECGRRLSRYSTSYGERRLRHNPRDRR